MSEILVTAAQLRSKAEELAKTNAQFKTQIDNLENTETSLMGMWDGDAKNAFHNAFASDKIQMMNFFNAIERYVAVLEEIAIKYENTELLNVEVGKTRKYK